MIGLSYAWLKSVNVKWLMLGGCLAFMAFSTIFLMTQFEFGLYHLFAGFHHNMINITLAKIASTLVLVMVFSIRAGTGSIIPPLAWLGAISFEMYLVEFKLISYFHMAEIANPFVAALSAVMITIIFAYLLRWLLRILSRTSSKASHALLGDERAAY